MMPVTLLPQDKIKFDELMERLGHKGDKIEPVGVPLETINHGYDLVTGPRSTIPNGVGVDIIRNKERADPSYVGPTSKGSVGIPTNLGGVRSSTQLL